jgi:hypothetical protein
LFISFSCSFAPVGALLHSAKKILRKRNMKTTSDLLQELQVIIDQYLKLVKDLSSEHREELISKLGDEETVQKYQDQELKRFDDEFKIMGLLIARSRN